MVTMFGLLLGCQTFLVPTTMPPTPPRGDGCDYNGRWYPVGEIERDVNNCYGTTCESGGGILYWDGKCFLDPPVCYGREEQVPGQCCKLCITSTDTTPTTTTTTTTTTTSTTTTTLIPTTTTIRQH